MFVKYSIFLLWFPFSRIDSLCRDILLFREAIPSHQYEGIFQGLVSARRILEMEDSRAEPVEILQPLTTPGGGEGGRVGRPKFQISEEQLRFFTGNLLTDCIGFIMKTNYLFKFDRPNSNL